MTTKKIARLLGSASVAAFVYAGAVSAQEAITDFADYGNTYVNWIDVNIDDDYDYEIIGHNFAGSEGALGAINTGLDQVAVTQFVNVGVQAGSDADTLIDLSHMGSEDDYNFILGATNTAIAHTTALDAILGGSQVAVSSFNTASLNIDAVGEDSAANVALYQAVGYDDHVYDGAGMYASNVMDAATAYAGTAAIDSATWDPEAGDGEGGYVNGVQQAAISINTFSLSSEVDTTVELAGQSLQNEEFFAHWEFDNVHSVTNSAVAFSPAPATDDLVDPRLASDLNDPSISNLDQIAALTFNTMSFGNAANADEGIEASTQDFTVYSYANSGGYEGAMGQEASFDNSWNELNAENALIATTDADIYGGFTENYIGMPYEGPHGIGNVSIDNASQVTALTINSIASAGEGDLTLKEIYAYGPDYSMIDHNGFDQDVYGLDYTAGIENIAMAATMDGDANVSNLDQIAQYSMNSIRSGGDLNGWNEEGNGISQYADYDFTGEDAYGVASETADIIYGASGLDLDNGINSVASWAIEGDANASDITQVMQLSANTVAVAGDMTSALDQYNTDEGSSWMEFTAPVNLISAVTLNGYDNTDFTGNASIDTAEQVALFSFNTASVGGALDTDYLDQHYDFNGTPIDESLNAAYAFTGYGDASASGLDQIAQLTVNSVSAGSLGGADSYIHQDAWGWDGEYFGGSNDINVRSGMEGNASIAESSQAFILNANAVRIDGAVTGVIEQDAVYLYAYDEGNGVNSAYAWANQDAGDARWAGGNASIEGLVQTLSISMNSISAGSLDGAYINQYAEDIDLNVGNYAYADAEWGAATMTGVSQATINRINSISITPASF